MSYASKTKTKLAKIELADKLLMRAELSAIARSIGELKLGTKFKINLSITTENSALARRIITHIKSLYEKKSEVIVKKNRSLKRHHIYEVVTEDAKKILDDLGVLDAQQGLSIVDEIPAFVQKSNQAKRAYIRGLFLSTGSMSAPTSNYHFELALHTNSYAAHILALLNTYELNAKMIERKNKFVIYLKDANKIVDILNIIGAHDSLLALENTRIVKSMRNKANRLVNCDTANLNKMMAASERQLRAIRIIETHMGLNKLSKPLIDVINVRKEYPEHTIGELGAMLSPPVSKSGVNHRLKKIESIANTYLEEHPND